MIALISIACLSSRARLHMNENDQTTAALYVTAVAVIFHSVRRCVCADCAAREHAGGQAKQLHHHFDLSRCF